MTKTNEYLASIREDVGSLKNNLAQDAAELINLKNLLMAIAIADDTRGLNPEYKNRARIIRGVYENIRSDVSDIEDRVITLQHELGTFDYNFAVLKEHIGQGEILGHLEFDEWEYTE